MRSLSMRLAIAAAAVALIAVAIFLLSSRSSDADTVDRIVQTCSSEQERDKCYEREVPPLYPETSVTELFNLIREIRHADRSYQFCHVLAHKIGERVVAEDPQKWIDAIPLNPPDGMCSNGFIHGVVGGRFRAEVLDDETITSLIPEFSRACEARPDWKPSDLDRAICYHGLGHLYDYITDANLEKALSICARTAGEQFSRVCIEGVFMQMFQPLEPDDFELIKRLPVTLSVETVRPFCESYERADFVGACLRESWPLFDDGIFSGEGVAAFCSGHPNADEERKCYESATAIIGRMMLGDSQKGARACNALPQAWHHTCFTTIARAAIEEDRSEGGREAVKLCMMAAGETSAKCLQDIATTATFIFGNDVKRKENFCAQLPEEYRTLCR